MNEQAPRMVCALDVAGWPRFNPNHRHPLWWGILGLIAIESTVVASLIASYFYLAMGEAPWPPAGTPQPALFWPTINVGLLLASAWAMYLSTRAINRGHNGKGAVALGAALLLDCLVLVLRWLQMEQLPFLWSDHAYGSIVWTLSGFHFAHVTSAVIGTAVVWWLAVRNYWTPERQLGSTVDAMYWYFVSLVWVPIYLTLYWAPRAMG